MVLKKLDYYEGIGSEFEMPNEYVRKKIEVVLKNGDKVSCRTYLYNRSIHKYTLIPSGKFVPNKS